MMAKERKPAGSVQVQVWLPAELLEWIDGEAERMERSRAWSIGHAVRMWRTRLERQRAKRGDKQPPRFV